MRDDTKEFLLFLAFFAVASYLLCSILSIYIQSKDVPLEKNELSIRGHPDQIWRSIQQDYNKQKE